MLPDLKVEVPELEPSPVLLEQLVQLSRHSTPSVKSGGPGTMKALMAAASVTVIAAVSWLTGTMPGVASPFSREPTYRPAPQHGPAEPSARAVSDDEAATTVTPPTEPPGQAKPDKPRDDNGLHLGQTKPHQNNGNHHGQTKPHHNNGNHHGQTKPHQNNGNHHGQTKPHQNNGNHHGQTKPHQNNGNHHGQTKPHQNNGQGR